MSDIKGERLMKLSTTRIVLLCGSLLLLPSASAGECRSSKPRIQPPQQAKPSSAQSTPQSPSLEGSYTLNDQTAATKIIKEAIDAAVKGMSILIRGTARDKLERANLPPPKHITISYTSTDVTIATEAGTIQTPADGKFVAIRGEAYKVSTKWKDGKLERTFKADGGVRVNTYRLSGDRKSLTLIVRFNSKWLKQAGTYELLYDYTQDADLIRLRQIAAKAEDDIGASFAAIKPKTISPRGDPKAMVEAYEPQDIIDLATREKNKLVAALSGERFAALRAYTERFYPIPEDPLRASHLTPDFDWVEDSKGKVYFSTLSFCELKSISFTRRLASLATLGQNAVDVTIDSKPDMADYVMSAEGGKPLTTTTNNVLRNVYRGWYTYKLSKPGYKTIEAPLDLVDGGSKLKCTMNKTTDSDGPHACKQQ